MLVPRLRLRAIRRTVASACGANRAPATGHSRREHASRHDANRPARSARSAMWHRAMPATRGKVFNGV
ncbi:hypothetical protein C7S13_8147 [Burkholderia cepacia]|nr:hypothetical protein [Burkholderia cepacia]